MNELNSTDNEHQIEFLNGVSNREPALIANAFLAKFYLLPEEGKRDLKLLRKLLEEVRRDTPGFKLTFRVNSTTDHFRFNSR